MSERRNQQGGFTLLELLMVIIIVAILASVAVPQYLKSTARARRSEAVNMLRQLADAEAAYISEHQAYTNLITDLTPKFDASLVTATPKAGSWQFALPAAGTRDGAGGLIVATGIASTTVANCTVTWALDNGALDETGAKALKDTGDTSAC